MIVDGNSTLSNHKFYESFNKSNKKHNNHGDKLKDKNNGGEIKEGTATLSCAQTEFSCWCCADKGYKSSSYHPRVKLLKYQWAMSKSKSQLLRQESEKRRE